jgi:hypothetical protein
MTYGEMRDVHRSQRVAVCLERELRRSCLALKHPGESFSDRRDRNLLYCTPSTLVPTCSTVQYLPMLTRISLSVCSTYIPVPTRISGSVCAKATQTLGFLMFGQGWRMDTSVTRDLRRLLPARLPQWRTTERPLRKQNGAKSTGELVS